MQSLPCLIEMLPSVPANQNPPDPQSSDFHVSLPSDGTDLACREENHSEFIAIAAHVLTLVIANECRIRLAVYGDIETPSILNNDSGPRMIRLIADQP